MEVVILVCLGREKRMLGIVVLAGNPLLLYTTCQYQPPTPPARLVDQQKPLQHL